MAASREHKSRPGQSAGESLCNSAICGWIRLATHPRTVRRAVLTALIVGAALIAINHGPAILQGEVTRARMIQMCLTILVPYIVSTASSVSTRRELGQDRFSAPIEPRSQGTSVSKENENGRQAE